MALVKLEQVSKVYRNGAEEVHAVRDVRLEVAAGEFVALVGPSGSGKSTILGLVGGLNPPSRGQVLIDDIDVYRLPVERQADLRSTYIGFVFQEHELLPYLTALENVLLPLAILNYSHSRQEAMAMEALGRVGLAGKGRRLPSQLSGGEQERVAIARAIVNHPPLILADEPTGSLDSQTGNEIMELFKELNSQGLTIIMVTHNLQNLEYANRVLTIRDGAVVDGREACLCG
ncbi:MAG: ABC transporter ATP-binding protein [Clostridia bacterium]|nr:MAG: ABC transporter ATP-binding protein [Clostridia bacterium]